MDERRRRSISRFLSFVLRHRPDAAGVELDDGGWVDVAELLRGCAAQGRPISRSQLDKVVATNPKQRFAFSEDGRRIRAQQGHSADVDLGYQPVEPPRVLFHGTVRRMLPSIRQQGLLAMERHHVHLSPDRATAVDVGGRRGHPVILRIDAAGMRAAGHEFYCTPNQVWLTQEVPVEFIADLDPD